MHALIARGDLRPHDAGWRFRRGAALSVPGSLRHAIEARLLRQPPAVRVVAEQAAVVGQVVNVARLASLSALDDRRLFAALRALVDARILIKQPDETITFRHALTREAIRTRLLQVERQTLHRRVALLLEADDDAQALSVAEDGLLLARKLGGRPAEGLLL